MMNSLSRQARICAALCHLAGAIWLTGGGLAISVIPALPGLVLVLSLLLPCLTWLLTRRVHDFVDRSGRAAVNAQLSMLLYAGCAVFACGNCLWHEVEYSPILLKIVTRFTPPST